MRFHNPFRRPTRHDHQQVGLQIAQGLLDGIETVHTERAEMTTSALAAVHRELTELRRDGEAATKLLEAVETVIRPAIDQATLEGRGVLIVYSPDEAVVARPSVGVPAGQVLLLRSDKVFELNGSLPIAFVGANS